MNVCTSVIINSDDKLWLPDNNTSVILTVFVSFNLVMNCFKVRHGCFEHSEFPKGVM